ncbi:MAG: carboxylesterase [Pseudomonadales bacterium]|nr:carboxylesterase [Pseudomonadales bacterium]
MTALSCELIEPTSDADAVIIWLHGLGASGHDFVPVVPHLGLAEHLAVRFIFPHAPTIPVTINGGMVMPAWYDILAIDLNRTIDEAQILASAASIRAIILEQMAAGISSKRIILAGFSQGGAVCYQTALSFEQPLAGLLILSSYFATADLVSLHPSQHDLPIRLYHGDADTMVQPQLAEDALGQLQALGLTGSLQHYSMGHEVCLAQIQDIGAAINQWLSSSG